MPFCCSCNLRWSTTVEVIRNRCSPSKKLPTFVGSFFDFNFIPGFVIRKEEYHSFGAGVLFAYQRRFLCHRQEFMEWLGWQHANGRARVNGFCSARCSEVLSLIWITW